MNLIIVIIVTVIGTGFVNSIVSGALTTHLIQYRLLGIFEYNVELRPKRLAASNFAASRGCLLAFLPYLLSLVFGLASLDRINWTLVGVSIVFGTFVAQYLLWRVYSKLLRE